MFIPSPTQIIRRVKKQHGQVATHLLSKLFTQVFELQLKQGRLDFLNEKKLGIGIEPTPYRLCLTCFNQKIQVLESQTKTDVCISGTPLAFSKLLTQTMDADTLFFQRKLRVEGNVALGLELKHFFANLDVAETNFLFRKLQVGLKWLLSQKPITA